MNEETRKEIGSALGKVLDLDGKAIVAEQACFLQVRIDIPLDKPLRRGAPVVNPEGDRSWVAFRYERIVGLCYSCGRLGHDMKICLHRCSSTNRVEPTDNPYCEWLKVGG